MKTTEPTLFPEAEMPRNEQLAVIESSPVKKGVKLHPSRRDNYLPRRASM